MRRLALASLLLAACGPSDDNGSGCKDTYVAGDLVITEVFADFQAPSGGTGTDTGKEWFEIYNNTERPLDLKGLTVVHSRPDGSKAQSHVMTEVTIAPGQYFTLGNATSDLVPAYVDYGYSADLGDFYNSDGGKLALKCGDAEIDSAVYDSVKSGHSRELSAAAAPDYTINDDLANWCQGDASTFEDGNFGTPGSENDCQPNVVGACSDGGVMRATVTPMPGDLVITEVMPNPAAVSDTTAEWFEVKALADIDLNGVGLDRAGDSSNPVTIDDPECLHVAAGSYVVFAKSDDSTMNGMLPPVAAKFSFSLVDGTTAAPGDVQILAGGNVIDAITWVGSTSGKAHSLDPAATDPASNDEPTNFCDATTAYGAGDLGTPGAANPNCPTVVGPGMCLDNGTPRAIVKPAAGALVINELMANPRDTGTDATQEWFEITNTGAAAFDLNELTLKGNAATGNTITSPACKSVAAGGFALFAHSADPLVNGGLPEIDATFTFSLAQTNGTITVLDGVTVLDMIAWATPTQVDGVANQLRPTFTNVTDNDNAAPSNTTNYCVAVAAQKYGTAENYGTPKAVNACM